MNICNYRHKTIDRTKTPAAVVLAGGLSRRFGKPKQLLMVEDRPLIVHVLNVILKVDLDPVILVTGCRSEDVRLALGSSTGLNPKQFKRLTLIHNPDYASGQASSVKAGLAAIGPGVKGAVFIMADQIGLKPEVLKGIIRTWQNAGEEFLIRPRYGGEPGGPVLWPKRFFPNLMNLTGDAGGRSLMKDLGRDTFFIDFNRDDYPVDIDTPQDYEQWLAGNIDRGLTD